jgi:hypothetical protein
MEKQELINKTKETLTPLETQNLFSFVQNMTVNSLMESPLLLGALALFIIIGFIRKSKFILGFLFTVIMIILLIRFTIPPEDQGLSLSTTVPFAAGGILIGAFLIYLFLIKSD